MTSKHPKTQIWKINKSWGKDSHENQISDTFNKIKTTKHMIPKTTNKHIKTLYIWCKGCHEKMVNVKTLGKLAVDPSIPGYVVTQNVLTNGLGFWYSPALM